jgi:hypothetical protein
MIPVARPVGDSAMGCDGDRATKTRNALSTGKGQRHVQQVPDNQPGARRFAAG